MARHTQVVTAGQTYCVYLNSDACGGGFVDDYCQRYFLTRLVNALRPFHVQLHAYAILNKEAYLLLTPGSATGLYALLNSVDENYTEYYQQRFERDSTPIKKNFGISRVDGKALALDCQKYIERRPLDCGLRQHAGAYEWSSYSANSFGCRSPYITPHKGFSGFLSSSTSPYRRYRELIATPFISNYLSYIDLQIKSGRPIAKRSVATPKPLASKRKLHEPESGETRSITF